MQTTMFPFPYSLTCSSYMNMRPRSPSGTPSPPVFEPSSPTPMHPAPQGLCLKTTSAGRVFLSGVRKSTAFTIEAILGLDSNCVAQQQVHSSTIPGERTYRTQHGLTATQNEHYDALPIALSPDSTRKERSKVSRTRTQSSDSCTETNLHKVNCGGSKAKRVRTIFTPEQLEKLEREFERQQYMVGPERLYLASALNLTEAQVKVWFQNRRIKWRKQHLELQQARLAKIRRDSSDFEVDEDAHLMDQEASSPSRHEL